MHRIKRKIAVQAADLLTEKVREQGESYVTGIVEIERNIGVKVLLLRMPGWGLGI